MAPGEEEKQNKMEKANIKEKETIQKKEEEKNNKKEMERRNKEEKEIARLWSKMMLAVPSLDSQEKGKLDLSQVSAEPSIYRNMQGKEKNKMF